MSHKMMWRFNNVICLLIVLLAHPLILIHHCSMAMRVIVHVTYATSKYTAMSILSQIAIQFCTSVV